MIFSSRCNCNRAVWMSRGILQRRASWLWMRTALKSEWQVNAPKSATLSMANTSWTCGRETAARVCKINTRHNTTRIKGGISDALRLKTCAKVHQIRLL